MLQLVLGTGLTAAALPWSVAIGAVHRVGLISDLKSSNGSTSHIHAIDQGLDPLIGLKQALVVAAGYMVQLCLLTCSVVSLRCMKVAK